MSEEVCKTCPNIPYCAVYAKYGEVHTKTHCIDYTSEMRYGYTIADQIKRIKSEGKKDENNR